VDRGGEGGVKVFGEGGGAEAVIEVAGGGVGEDAVGEGDGFEAVFGLWGGVEIGVEALGEGAVGALEGFVFDVRGDAEGGVEVGLAHGQGGPPGGQEKRMWT
jgi:hypothetical protein